MATSNFMVVNARGHYVVDDTEFVEERLDDIRERASELGFSAYDRDTWHDGGGFGNRNYPSLIVTSRDMVKVFESGSDYCEMSVEGLILSTNGYYSDAVLDWDVQICTNYGETFCLSSYENVEEYCDEVARFVCEYDDMVERTDEMREWLIGIVSALCDECDGVCKSACDEVMEVFARFSNGETLYSRVG